MDKRRTVLELVKLGMALDSAAYTAECSAQEMLEMQEDDEFMRHVAASHAILERDLLKKLHTVLDMNTNIGNSTEVRWMLERVNSERWGSSSKVQLSGNNGESLFRAFDDTKDTELADIAGLQETTI